MIESSLLHEIHEKYYGAQDKAIDGLLSVKPDTLEIDETRTPITNTIKLTKDCIDMWPDGKEAGKRYAITNIKILNYHELEIGDSVIIEIGGQRYHHVYIATKEDIKECLFSSFHYQDLIPGLIYHDFKISYINYDDNNKKKDFSIEYTLLPIKDFEEGFNQILFTKQYSFGDDHYYPIQLQFHHPVTELNVYTEREVLEGYLNIDNTYKLPLTKVSENHWKITFQDLVENRLVENSTTINFSRINNLSSCILFSEKPGSTTVVADTVHIYRIFSNMAGLAFTK